MLVLLEKFVMGLSRLVTLIGALIIVLMMVHVTADVVSKFLFSKPLPGTITFVSSYYMVTVTFLCLCVVEARNAHIDVELIAQHLPKRIQKILTAFALVIGLGVFGTLTWKSSSVAYDKFEVGAFETEQRVKVITWPSYFLVPIGAGLMTLMIFTKIAGRRFDLKHDTLADLYERANELEAEEEEREKGSK
ncbi:TRAP transporter small permease [Celeribacter litoreus]|uniref:TRAP transporter small permease n=1 Tax=Celeribacter litoreus TaxID=2876714 RepID=UPI001CCEC55C|nr:TRAP transporter small permease [Celeribacter litoreus]MCA0043378.1 TRAP transporter small permease [Celeribacter litoreus]